MASSRGDATAVVPTSENVSEAPSWEVRMLLERAAELERLQRFEEALVLYHRGRLRAPLVPDFQEGVRRAKQAVMDAIGSGASELFSDIPGLLPGMIEEQRSARMHSRRAARMAHERLRDAVQSMTFAETTQHGMGHRYRDDDNVGDDEGKEVSMQVALVDDTRPAAPWQPAGSGGSTK